MLRNELALCRERDMGIPSTQYRRDRIAELEELISARR
jgi:hypothetical protein